MTDRGNVIDKSEVHPGSCVQGDCRDHPGDNLSSQDDDPSSQEDDPAMERGLKESECMIGNSNHVNFSVDKSDELSMQTNQHGASNDVAEFLNGRNNVENKKECVIGNETITDETERTSDEITNKVSDYMNETRKMYSCSEFDNHDINSSVDRNEDGGKNIHLTELNTGQPDISENNVTGENANEDTDSMKGNYALGDSKYSDEADCDVDNCDIKGALVESHTCALDVTEEENNVVNTEDKPIEKLTSHLDSEECNTTDISDRDIYDKCTARGCSSDALIVSKCLESYNCCDTKELDGHSISYKTNANIVFDSTNSHTVSHINKCYAESLTTDALMCGSGMPVVSYATKPVKAAQQCVYNSDDSAKHATVKTICNSLDHDQKLSDGTVSEKSDTDDSVRSMEVKSTQRNTHNLMLELEKGLLKSKDNLMNFAEILYKCTLCTTIPSIFTSKESFITHVSQQHLTRQRRFVNCSKCSLKFPTDEDMKEHSAIVHRYTDVDRSHNRQNSDARKSLDHNMPHDQLDDEDSDSGSSGHGSIGCLKTKNTELEKDFKEPNTNCNHAGIEMKNGCLDLSLKYLMASQQDTAGRCFKPKTERYSPRSNEIPSPHVDMSQLHKITAQIVKSNTPNKNPSDGLSIGFTPSYTPEFGKFTKLVREGGNIVYFCQVCNWKSPVKSTFQIHCGLSNHKIKVTSAEEQGNGCSEAADFSQAQRNGIIDINTSQGNSKTDQSPAIQYNLNSSPNVCINKRSSDHIFQTTDTVSWMSQSTPAISNAEKPFSLRGLPFRTLGFGEKELPFRSDISNFETVKHAHHKNVSLKKHKYVNPSCKDDLEKSSVFFRPGELAIGTSSTRHKRPSPPSRRHREWSDSDSDSGNDTQKKRVHLGPRKHKTRILSSLLKPKTFPERYEGNISSFGLQNGKRVTENHGDGSTQDQGFSHCSNYADSKDSYAKIEQALSPHQHDQTDDNLVSNTKIPSATPRSIDLSIVKKESTDTSVDRKYPSENISERELQLKLYNRTPTVANTGKLHNQKHENGDNMDSGNKSSSMNNLLFKLYKCHACLFEYCDITEYEHHFETVHKLVPSPFTSLSQSGSKMSSKSSDTELGSVEMNENWRVNKLKDVLADHVTVDEKGNVSRDFLLQRVSAVTGIPDMTGWSSACNRAMREVFPSSLAHRKGKYKKTYFFGVSMVDTPVNQEEMPQHDLDLLTQQPLRDMSVDMEKIFSHMPAVVYWSGDMEHGVYRDQMLVLLADTMEDPDVKSWGAQCNRAIRLMFPQVEMKRKGKFKTTVYFGVDFVNGDYQAFVDSPKLSTGLVKTPANNQESCDRQHVLDMLHGKIKDNQKEAASDLSLNPIGCLKNSPPSHIAEDSPREGSSVDTREGTPMDTREGTPMDTREADIDVSKDKSRSSMYSPVYPSWFQKEARSEMKEYLTRFGGVSMFETNEVDNDGDDECDTLDNEMDDTEECADKTILNVPVIEKVGERF